MTDEPKKKGEPEAAPKAAQKPEAKSEAPKKPAYVFKIVPADPKNAFDFEDVADK
jgi:hypothetical protein